MTASFARWVRGGSISRRLVLLVGLLCACALLAATYLRHEDEQRLGEIGRATTAERQRLVAGIVANDARQPELWIRSAAEDPRLARSLEAGGATGDGAVRALFDTSRGASGIAAVALYDARGFRRSVVASNATLGGWNPGVEVPPARTGGAFARTRAGLVSVVRTPVRSRGRVVGTLVAVRPWTRAALDRLARATGTRVAIVNHAERLALAGIPGEDRFHWFEEMKDARGRTLAYRHFSANSPVVAQYRISALRNQTFLLLLVAAFLGAVGTFLGVYVGRPLRQVRGAVAAGTTEHIQHLLDDTTEIGEQARVVEDWITVRNELVSSNEWLDREVRERTRELSNAYTSTIRALVTAMEYRDQETKGHCERVTEMAETLGRSLRLSEIEIDDLRRGALLHDIGKIAIPDTVLLKPGALTPAERTLMETHAEIGYDMLKGIRFLERALDIPRFHHEKWDATGYPHGYGGEDIPMSARIFALVDVWDALSSTRPYRQAWSPERVRDHILSLSGTHFDPTVVAAFERIPLEAFPTEYRDAAGGDALGLPNAA